MARPSHDIPNLLLGGIRDYADQHDISSEEAHRRLLRRALKEVDILSCTGMGPIAGEESLDETDEG